jgi:hypothetical protein
MRLSLDGARCQVVVRGPSARVPTEATEQGFRHPMYVTCQAATNSGVLVRCAQAVFSS